MSSEKRTHEAERWLSQARADLRAARNSQTSGDYSWSCFQCQQAGEKALKAIWLAHGMDPWGHSLLRLVLEHGGGPGTQSLRDLEEPARLLDKLYIPTRYPNGLPDLTPAEVYGDTDAQGALLAAARVVDAAVRALGASEG